jgi:NADH-quinone oxidoreductase subunit N
VTMNDFFSIMPAAVMALFGTSLLLMRLDSPRFYLIFFVVGEVLAGLGLWRQADFASMVGFGRSIVIDPLGVLLNGTCSLAALLAAAGAYQYMEREGEDGPEFYALILFAQSGMYLMISGMELITVFVGLEIAAISLYVLTGFFRHKKTSNEAALKYFLLGAFSSGILLYGFSMLYGLTGQTRYSAMRSLDTQTQGAELILLTVVPLLFGLLLKVAAAPLHIWAPDAYEGAPTPVTAFLATAGKVAGFAVMLRLLLGPLSALRSSWEGIVMFAAVASLIIGNFAAITQQSAKRLLAYSSIGHAGYILLGFVSGNRTGIEGMAVYLAAYAIMTTGAFLVLAAMKDESVSGFRGLLYRHPLLALAMIVLLLSLAGLPPTAGFVAKYLIFLSLLQTGHYVLAVFAAVYVAVALYYYFRIVREMTLQPEGEMAPLTMSHGWRAAVGVASILSLGIGLNPEPLLAWARMAIR